VIVNGEIGVLATFDGANALIKCQLHRGLMVTSLMLRRAKVRRT